MLPPKLAGLVLCLLSSIAAQDVVYTSWAADSAIARGQGNGLDEDGNPAVSYDDGVLWWGLQLMYEKTGNSTYYDYIVSGAQNIVDEDGNISDDYKYVFP